MREERRHGGSLAASMIILMIAGTLIGALWVQDYWGMVVGGVSPMILLGGVQLWLAHRRIIRLGSAMSIEIAMQQALARVEPETLARTEPKAWSLPSGSFAVLLGLTSLSALGWLLWLAGWQAVPVLLMLPAGLWWTRTADLRERGLDVELSLLYRYLRTPMSELALPAVQGDGTTGSRSTVVVKDRPPRELTLR